MSEPWAKAAALACGLLSLTSLAAKLLNQDRKDEIALWLLGAGNEETWDRSFCSLFDALFGKRHLSLRCLWRSSLASIVSVSLIWLFFANAGIIVPGHEARLQADARVTGTDVALGSVVLYAVIVNLIADYFSLVQTRWFLGKLRRYRSWLFHTAFLLTDLLVSVLITFFAIQLTVNASSLRDVGMFGWPVTLGEIIVFYSIYSVLFYSTFLTSLWSWSYVASTWTLRLFTRTKASYWLDIENKPIVVLGHVLALIVFVVTLLANIPFERGQDGTNAFDRFLCDRFGGQVCIQVSRSANDLATRSSLVYRGCIDHEYENFKSGDGVSECVWAMVRRRLIKGDDEITDVLRLSCSLGSVKDCIEACERRGNFESCQRLQEFLESKDKN